MTLKCTMCKESLPVENFNINKQARSGRCCWCKKCTSFYYSAEEKSKRISRIVEHRQRKIQNSLEGYSSCFTCKQVLPNQKFGKNKLNKSGFDGTCKDCRKKRYTASGGPAKKRIYDSSFNSTQSYSLTKKDLFQLFQDQNYRCACGKCFIEIFPTDKRREWQIDHDHACCDNGSRSCGKCVRGILCAACNFMLGVLKEDPLLLPHHLNRYLNTYKVKEAQWTSKLTVPV